MLRHGLIEQAEKLEPFLVSMPFLTKPVDLAVGRMESGKQGGGAVAFIVVGHGLAAPALQRQSGLGTATHKHPKVQRWLERRRFHMHFTPTSASWLNRVERFFRDLTQNRLRRGVFRDLEELVMAIGTYIDRHNHDPKPFIWTARASDILEKVKRARRALHKRQSA